MRALIYIPTKNNERALYTRGGYSVGIATGRRRARARENYRHAIIKTASSASVRACALFRFFPLSSLPPFERTTGTAHTHICSGQSLISIRASRVRLLRGQRHRKIACSSSSKYCTHTRRGKNERERRRRRSLPSARQNPALVSI